MTQSMTCPELVLTFHGIGTPPAEIPADEVPYWMATDAFSAYVASLSDWARRTGTRLLATFDDGNKSDLLTAVPILKEHKVSGAFFICANRLDTIGYLDAADIKDLAAMGFEVGSHGMDHVPWTSLQGAALEREICESKAILEAALGASVSTAAIPFGAYNRNVLKTLRAAGYKHVYSSDPGISPSNSWLRRRWSFKVGQPFEPNAMLQRSSEPKYRAILAAKQLFKSLR